MGKNYWGLKEMLDLQDAKYNTTSGLKDYGRQKYIFGRLVFIL